jgi:prepilin-type N-terminal cleavage/methylation domain-containing protein
MQIKSRGKSGFTLVEIMIVVAIIGLLAAIAIPNFVKARTASQTNACVANLKQIQSAIYTWALETKRASTSGVTFSDIVGSTLYLRTMPACPANGTYAISTVDQSPSCTVSGHVLP